MLFKRFKVVRGVYFKRTPTPGDEYEPICLACPIIYKICVACEYCYELPYDRKHKYQYYPSSC